MNDPVLVFHHAPCLDGFSAGRVIARGLAARGRSAETIGLSYDDVPPDVTGRDVVMTDVSFDRATMERLCAQARSFLLLDHHVSAREALTDIEGDGITLVFDMEACGATIAWRHYFGTAPLPRFLAYVEDLDLWRKRMPDTNAFSAAASTLAFEDAAFDALIDDDAAVDALIAEGRAMRKLIEAQVAAIAAEAFPVMVDGRRGLMVTGAAMQASDLGAFLSQKADFAIVFRIDAERMRLSFRSKAPHGADVSRMAGTFGGGGHRHAAGATLSLEDGMAFLRAAARAAA